MLTEFQLGQISVKYAQCQNVSETSRELGISRRAITAAVKRDFQVSAKKSRRTPAKISLRRRTLKKIATETAKVGHRTFPRHASAKKIKSELMRRTKEQLSVRQVQRELKKCGLKAYKRPTCPTKRVADLSVKKQFALRHKKIQWKRVVFSDESWLSCNENTGKVQWASARECVHPIERKSRWNVASIMVWGCVGYNYKSELIIFPSKKDDNDGNLRTFRLDAASYVRRCLSSVAKDLVSGKKIFQQDGARSHAAKSTKAYLSRKRIEWLQDWPPYCPDLNMIEYVWKDLAEAVGAMCPLNAEELVRCAKKAWEEMPQEKINRHCAHFAHMLARV